ncbi:MAG: hypothetical protein AAGC76_05325 [Luteibacter sp.]|uniref:hypothetical protein n=1 Tax=Luteibacter sp. TaxID=1886636 RepID=UPI002807A543|nr:hypothetical protein [Luteibacter sp.]MDQ7995258.1 hypothetical protein [Luteibacter sp.]
MYSFYDPLSVVPWTEAQLRRTVVGRCQEGLGAIEACLLAIVHSNPNLASARYRKQLRAVMAFSDGSFTPEAVGLALASVRALAEAGVVDTDAFLPSIWPSPSAVACEEAYQTVAAVLHRAISVGDRAEFHRLMRGVS